jgi:hypothetical protein
MTDIPLISSINKNVKSIIIEIILNTRFINTKKIHNLLLKKYNRKVSYQAVHKALKEMQKDKILIKIGKEYSIDKDYIEKLEDFLNSLKKSQNSNFNIFEKKEVERLNFASMFELLGFIVNALDMKYFTDEYNENYVWMKHFWQIPPNTPTKNIFQKWMEESKKTRVLVSNNTLVDKLFSSYFKYKYYPRKNELKIKVGVKDDPGFELLIINDTIVQIYFPEEILGRINRLFSGFKNIINPTITNDITEISHMKTSINVVIIRNKEISDDYKRQIDRYLD